MRIMVNFLFLAFGVCGYPPALAESVSKDTAEHLWKQSKNRPGYSEYQQEFVQYNNYFHLDTKDNCFNRGDGEVTVYLIISGRAIVKSVVVDRLNAKASCFKKAYKHLPVKVPPFVPFVIKMNMQ